MDEKKIFQEFCNILKLYTKNPELLDTATKETHILNDLKVNSARLVDVVIKCEDVFGISIDDLLSVDGVAREPADVYRKVSAVKLHILAAAMEEEDDEEETPVEGQA